jgi:hypothetical protein
MSDWNPLDLRKWKPRRPSPELRARIFGSETQTSGVVAFDLRELTRWIVPAMGCFLLVLGSLSSHLQPHYGIDLAATNFVLPSLDDDAVASVPPSSSTKHSVMNSIPAKTVEWNFGPKTAATTMGTILISYTNKLISK